MDIYLPANPVNAPVMVYVHGGGWSRGDKARTGNKVDYFNSRGWIFISMNYRLFPEGRHPNNVEDVAQAIAWVNNNIKNRGGNPDQIFIMGHSAGAHLVALVATDERPLQKSGKDLSVIKGVIPLDTQAYDIPELLSDQDAKLYRTVFSDDPKVWRDASPIHHVTKDKGIPPFFICYSRGMGKQVNPGRYKQADNFASALQVFGIHAEIIDASDRDHGEINQWFGKPDDKKVTGAAERFLTTILSSSRPRER